MTTEERLAEVMRAYGVGEARARFILALRDGETAGDDQVVDADGREVVPPRPPTKDADES